MDSKLAASAVLDMPALTADRRALFDEVFEQACREKLRQRASSLCKRERVPVFHTGDLLSELYLKLCKHPTYSVKIALRSRLEFMYMASKAMHHILTDLAREQKPSSSVTLSAAEGHAPVTLTAEQLLDLGLTLETLSAKHPRQADMIIMRYYGGLSIREIQQFWGVSDATVERELQRALKFMGALLRDVRSA